MSMAGLVEANAPLAQVEVTASRLDPVGPEECLQVVGPKGAEHPAPEALEGALDMLTGHGGRELQLQMHGAPC